MMQGPSAPWCVGSVFFPPQLLTYDVGPLLFNQLGNPQRLLSSGQELQPSGTAISTSKQAENFIQGSPAPFIPRDLLQDHLQSDSSGEHGSQFRGNLLQGLKCSDGSVVVFFPCGEGADQIGSTVCRQGGSGKWYAVQTSLSSTGFGPPKQPGWPVSSSLQHSIHQLSAVWARSSGDGDAGRAIVAARTSYHIYFCTVSREGDWVQFISTAVSKFDVPVAHVTWNPHVNGEAAVILGSGSVCLFNVEGSENGDPNRFVDLIATVTLKSPMKRLLAKPSGHLTAVPHNKEQIDDHNEPGISNDLQDGVTHICEKVQELEKNWWHCEFGWLPQTLLVTNSHEIFLVDLIAEQNCLDPIVESSGREYVDAQTAMSGLDIVATVGASDTSQFCSSKSGKENILAFGRDDKSGMYEFSVATERHIILFDTRQPQTPILQWEHGMKQEPPSLLIMCPLSALQSFDNEDKSRGIQNGRAILAASFKSGDVRVFCYGSEVSRVELPLGKKRKMQNVEGHEWGNAMHAWDISSRLYAPLAHVEDWRDVLSSSQGLFSQNVDGLFVPKSCKGQANVAGIVLLSEPLEIIQTERRKTFTVLQLTGEGELLAQTYEASHELRGPLKASISSSDNMFDAEESVEAHGPKHLELKYEVLPAFLKYIHTGSILHPPSSKNLDKAQESIIADSAETAVNPGQDGTRREKWRTQDSPVLGPKLEKKMHEGGLETQLKTFLRDLNVPLNMYEVAQKVLGMRLPERLALLHPGIPSDLNNQWQSGYKFPSGSPLLGVKVPSPKSGDHRGEENSVDHTSSSNVFSRTRSFEGKVPLPLLLEIHTFEKPIEDPSSAHGAQNHIDPHESGHIVYGVNLTSTEQCNGAEDLKFKEMPFQDGHKLLVEGSQNVEVVMEELVSRNEPTVVSLSEPTENWQSNSNGDGDSDYRIFLYCLPEKGLLGDTESRDLGKTHSVIATDMVTDAVETLKPTQEVIVDNLTEKSDTFREDIYRKFVVGKASSIKQERHPPDRYLRVDPNLCPIKLCFTAPEEELEQGELRALEDMQADFLRWQQSFPPYRSSY